jgi:lipid-A-disaccharide synthase-like uncharacterized protein
VHAPPRTARDPWDVWFWRFVQLLGVVLLVYELTHADPRVAIVSVALAMMTGARGVEKLVVGWKS